MTFKIPQLFLTVCGLTRYCYGYPTFPKPGSMNDSETKLHHFQYSDAERVDV